VILGNSNCKKMDNCKPGHSNRKISTRFGCGWS